MSDNSMFEIYGPKWPQRVQALTAAKQFRKQGLKASIYKDPESGSVDVYATKTSKEQPAPKSISSVDATDMKRTHFSGTYHKKGLTIHSVSSHQHGLGSKMSDAAISSTKNLRSTKPTIDLTDASPKTKERKGFLGLGGRKSFWDKKAEQHKDVNWNIREHCGCESDHPEIKPVPVVKTIKKIVKAARKKKLYK